MAKKLKSIVLRDPLAQYAHLKLLEQQKRCHHETTNVLGDCTNCGKRVASIQFGKR